jgi:hypothetical protein
MPIITAPQMVCRPASGIYVNEEHTRQQHNRAGAVPIYLPRPPRILVAANTDGIYTRIPGKMSLKPASLNSVRVKGGGFNGMGWVGQALSSPTTLCGTGLSSTGNNGSPVSRSSTKT